MRTHFNGTHLNGTSYTVWRCGHIDTTLWFQWQAVPSFYTHCPRCTREETNLTMAWQRLKATTYAPGRF